MINTSKNYFSKLLLFGEYTIIKDSQALAIPLDKYFGHWAFATDKEQAETLQYDLIAFVRHLSQLQEGGSLLSTLNTNQLLDALEKKHLYFDSTIARGYGLGSSGALCAAIYDQFALSKISPDDVHSIHQLKNQLAQLESFFHGASSGVDPLIAYVARPLFVHSKDNFQFCTLPDFNPAASNTVFLIDTNIARQTEALVQIFLQKCEDVYYTNRLEASLIPDVEEAIHYFLSGNGERLMESVHKISFFQYKYFLEMIPEAFQQMWLNGLSSSTYKLKLCGAGGGGFILGFTQDFAATQQSIKEYTLIPVYRF